MLRTLQNLESCAIGATDGPVGQVKDFYFDDDTWVIRYLVVDTGSWLNSRKVLISPLSVRHPDVAGHLLPVAITREQVKNSPDIDTDKPVSRQQEERYLGYYGYPTYWGGMGLWGEGLYPYAMLPDYVEAPLFGTAREERERERLAYKRMQRERHRNDDPHLRSCKAVSGYHVHARDGEIGHVDGLLVDEETWAIRCIVINTSNWWMGHKVLVAPQWITEVRWSDATVHVDLTRDSIQASPVFDGIAELNRQREEALYAHHGRDRYWTTGSVLETEI